MTPEQLVELVSRAKAAIVSDPRGHLPRPLRVEILRSFGTTSTELGFAPVTDGLKLRTKIAINSVEKALPLWDTFLPNDPAPRRMLELTDQIIAEGIDRQLLVSQRHYFRSYSENLGGEYPNDIRCLVAEAASQTLDISFFDYTTLDDQVSEDDTIGFEEADPSYIISSVFAGGWLNQPLINTEARRAFWNWYLTENILSLYSEWQSTQRDKIVAIL